jgi:SAM-dependent methyltransferase
MSTTCPVCGVGDVELQGQYRGQHVAFTGMHRAQCRGCRMVFATPMPPEHKLQQYNASYFNSAHGGKPQGAAALAFFSGIARLRLAHLQRYLSSQRIAVSQVTEIGPGPGWFARSWLAQNPGTTYRAIETDASCHVALREIGVQLISVEDTAHEARPTDLVVMTHVLEHVADPLAFLRETTRRLRPGGVLFIEVPCRDWEHKHLDEPHLLFFDKGPMQLLLERLGFGQIQLSYHGQKIEYLRRPSRIKRMWNVVRNRLVIRGVIAPFGRLGPGMESLSALERAAVRPFDAHLESAEPAWWLRAVARKTGTPGGSPL